MTIRSSASKLILAVSTLLLCLLLNACVPAATTLPPTPTEPPLPTSTPLPTATLTPLPTSTPLPTDTPTPMPTDTPIPTSTQNRTATAEVRATQEHEKILARVLEDLEPYNLSVDEGQLVWSSKNPTRIELEGYNVYDYEMIGKKLSLSNFILKTDITWDSKTGLMTCGLIFRSGQDFENGPHYLFQTLRLSGIPAWDIEFWNYGYFDHNVTGSVRSSGLIDQKSGATNQYVIVAENSVLTVYANMQRLGSAHNSKRSDGFLAFYGYQESGDSTCKFDNTWVWELP